MNSPARIAEEFLQLRDSDFWLLYNSELDKLLAARLDKLRNGALDTILYTQGAVKMIELVKGLPDYILSELAKKSQEVK